MKLRYLATLAVFATFSSAFVFADAVTLNTNATQLAAAVTSGNTGVTVTGATLEGQSLGAAASTGTFANIYGLQTGAVISTGNAADYGSGPNVFVGNSTSYGPAATAAQNLLLDPLTAGNATHYDVTQLDLNFTVLPNVNKIFFNVAFGSEEFPQYVGSTFVDAFGLYLNGVNIAFVNGLAVNIDHPCFQALAGTELNGVLACGGDPVNTFSGGVHAGTNTLTFIIADTSDSIIDTTAYIGALGTTDVTTTPEPGSLALLGTGALVVVGVMRRRLIA